MKKWQSASVIAAVTLVTVFASNPAFILRAQPQLTAAQAAALQPTPPSLVPDFGNFWSVSRPDYPPLPFDNYPDLPVYRLPDGSYLVDDSTVQVPPPPPTNVVAAARNSLIQSTLASQGQLLSLMVNQNMLLNESDSTNSPPEEDPCPPQLVDTNSVPDFGTFWFMTQTNNPPLPFDPCTGCDVYLLCDGSYLVDDTAYAWPQTSGGDDGGGTQQTNQYIYVSGDFWLEITGVTNDLANLILHGTASGVAYTIMSRRTLTSDDPWDAEAPLVGAAGQDWTPIQIPTFGRPVLLFQAVLGSVTPQRLWLCAVSISDNYFNCVLHGTTEGVNYDLLSVTSLSTVNNWSTETNFPGASSQFWTPVSIPLSGRSNPNLFLSARSWVDTSGSGIPDWWQLQYFGHTGVDPYADADGDGWNNFQEFLLGTSPVQANPPPSPQNVTATLDSTGRNIIISWDGVPGPVTEYDVFSYVYGLLGTVGPSARTFTITNAFPSYDLLSYINGDSYGVGAVTANGTGNSGMVFVTMNDMWYDATIARGPNGQFYVRLLSPSTNLATVRIYSEYLDHYGNAVLLTFDLARAAFTNGVAALPKSQTERWPYCIAHARGISTDGKLGASTDLAQIPWLWAPYWPLHHEFVDASAEMNQNLQFLLRSATVKHGFSVSGYYGEASTNYACVGFLGGLPFDGMLPVQQHYIWRNFVYDSVDGTYDWSTGVGYDMNSHSRTAPNPKYYVSGFTNPPALAFTLSPSSYVYSLNLQVPFDDPAGFAELGLVPYPDGTLGLNPNVKNAYGLPISGVQIINSGLMWTLSPGGRIGPLDTNLPSPYFANVTPPDLQPNGYFFNFADNANAPGSASFSTAEASPPLLTGYGQPVLITGWEKKAVANGYSNTFGYLQQYFDTAYKVATNGSVTAQQTGLLSPYGELLPTEPGPMALVTLPDMAGQRGTSIVQVVKFQFDVNHDGIMDLSLDGPDNTSYFCPFVFWANNNYDRPAYDDADATYYEDDLGPKQVAKLPAAQQVPDCLYTSNYLAAIPCQRDLEDFSRMWVVGLSSLMSSLPSNYTVQLSSSWDGAIRVFRAFEPDGGTNYLFDPLSASNQVANSTSLFVGVLARYQPITLTGLPNLGEHFIFCGVTPGWIDLKLQLLDPGQNVVGTATGYIEIVDIKDLYERWTVGERPGYGPTNIAQRAVENLPAGENTSFQYPTNTAPNTPYILFVHGWNMDTYDKDRFAETAFKRLYWQGYQGRFGIFRWPTDYGFKNIVTLATNPDQKDNYDRSEYQAWQSGAGLLNKLNDLNIEYPGHVYMLAHSMGNVVAGEALRLAGDSQVVKSYVASQAAISAHTYGTNIPNYSFYYPLLSSSPATPNIYGDWFASNNGGGAGTVVSFYNTNDYALKRSVWQLNQLLKPDKSVLLNRTNWNYVYSGNTNDPPPWNNFSKYTLLPFGPILTVDFDIVNNLNNRYEVMGLAAQSWTTALGATPGVQHVADAVNLGIGIWPPDLVHPDHPYDEHFYHSAQFRGDCAQQQGYWSVLLGADGFNLEHP